MTKTTLYLALLMAGMTVNLCFANEAPKPDSNNANMPTSHSAESGVAMGQQSGSGGGAMGAAAADTGNFTTAARKDPKTPHAYVMAPMTVVATRTERELFSTPAAVSRIGSDFIDETQPYSFSDIFETIPGVGVLGGPRRIAEEPVIRGFQDEQVVIRTDGTRQSFNQAHRGRFLLDPDLIDSIEIIRGAASAVYGSGALGGVFAIETKNGRSYTGGESGAGVRTRLSYQSNGDELGSYNTLYAQYGDFDFLGSYVFRKVYDDLEDGAENDILATQDELDNVLLKVGWQPGEDHRLEYNYEYFENQGLNPPNANVAATPTTIVDRDTERENHRVRYQFNPGGLDWLDMQAVIYRNEIDVDEFRLDDERNDTTDFETEGLEFFNTSRFDIGLPSPVALTYGVEFYEDRQSGTRNDSDRPEFPDAEVNYRAGFIQAELDLGWGISLIPGVRYDSFEYDADNFSEINREDDKVTPKVALGFQPNKHWYLWGEYSRAFRGPSLTELFADGVHFLAPIGPGQVVINEFVPTPELQPETADQFQVGMRYRNDNLLLDDDAFSFEVTAFHSDVDDYVEQFVVFISGAPTFDPITQTLVFPGITSNRNVDARFKGIEAELRYDWDIFFSAMTLSVLDAQQRNSEFNLASTPPNQLSLRGGVVLFDRTLTLGAEGIFAADRSNVPDGGLTTHGYGKVDLFASWLPQTGLMKGFEMRFNVDNLLDKNYRIHPNGVNQPGLNFRVSLGKTFDIF